MGGGVKNNEVLRSERWRQTSHKFKEQIEFLNEEVRDLSQENERLKRTVSFLTNEVYRMSKSITTMDKINTRLNNDIKDLQEELEIFPNAYK